MQFVNLGSCSYVHGHGMGPVELLTHYDVLVVAMAGLDLAMAPMSEDMAAQAVDVVGVAVDAVWRFFPDSDVHIVFHTFHHSPHIHPCNL